MAIADEDSDEDSIPDVDEDLNMHRVKVNFTSNLIEYESRLLNRAVEDNLNIQISLENNGINVSVLYSNDSKSSSPDLNTWIFFQGLVEFNDTNADHNYSSSSDVLVHQHTFSGLQFVKYENEANGTTVNRVTLGTADGIIKVAFSLPTEFYREEGKIHSPNRLKIDLDLTDFVYLNDSSELALKIQLPEEISTQANVITENEQFNFTSDEKGLWIGNNSFKLAYEWSDKVIVNSTTQSVQTQTGVSNDGVVLHYIYQSLYRGNFTRLTAFIAITDTIETRLIPSSSGTTQTTSSTTTSSSNTDDPSQSKLDLDPTSTLIGGLIGGGIVGLGVLFGNFARPGRKILDYGEAGDNITSSSKKHTRTGHVTLMKRTADVEQAKSAISSPESNGLPNIPDLSETAKHQKTGHVTILKRTADIEQEQSAISPPVSGGIPNVPDMSDTAKHQKTGHVTILKRTADIEQGQSISNQEPNSSTDYLSKEKPSKGWDGTVKGWDSSNELGQRASEKTKEYKGHVSIMKKETNIPSTPPNPIHDNLGENLINPIAMDKGLRFKNAEKDNPAIRKDSLRLDSIENDVSEKERGITINTSHVEYETKSVAKGMEHLKSEGIVHRDIATRNIPVTPNNSIQTEPSEGDNIVNLNDKIDGKKKEFKGHVTLLK